MFCKKPGDRSGEFIHSGMRLCCCVNRITLMNLHYKVLLIGCVCYNHEGLWFMESQPMTDQPKWPSKIH